MAMYGKISAAAPKVFGIQVRVLRCILYIIKIAFNNQQSHTHNIKSAFRSKTDKINMGVK